MKNYERDLKKLLDLTEYGCRPIHQTSCEMSENQLRFLSAKGLISLKPAGDNEFFIIIAPAGLTYFSDKRESRAYFVKEHAAYLATTFLAGFASGLLTALLIGWLV